MIYHFPFFVSIYFLGSRLNDVRKNTPCLHSEQKKNIFPFVHLPNKTYSMSNEGNKNFIERNKRKPNIYIVYV